MRYPSRPLEVPAELEFTLYHDRLKLIDRGSRHHTSNLAVGQGESRPHLASSRLTRRRVLSSRSCSDAPSKPRPERLGIEWSARTVFAAGHFRLSFFEGRQYRCHVLEGLPPLLQN